MKRLRQVTLQVLIYLNTPSLVFSNFLQKSTVLGTSVKNVSTRHVCLNSLCDCVLISRLFPSFSTRANPSFVEL